MGFFSNLFGGKQETARVSNRPQTVSAKSMPAIGRPLSWNNNRDVAFAIGSFIAGMNANGSILVAENGTLTFLIGSFAKNYNYIDERVPSDVRSFLSSPSILKVQDGGAIMKLEFETQFKMKEPLTLENMKSSVNEMLKIVSNELQEGAKATGKISGRYVKLEFREDGYPFASSKTLWIKS